MSELEATQLLKAKRGILRETPERSILLRIEPGDEDDPRVIDLFGKMLESRETVYRETVDPYMHTWVWQHKRQGEELEAYRQIQIEELRRTGVIK